MTKNLVKGKRAQDEFMKDWSDIKEFMACDASDGGVEGGGSGGSEAGAGRRRGLSEQDQATKTNNSSAIG